MVKIYDVSSAEEFLKSIRLQVEESVVRTVVNTVRGKSGLSFYDLHRHGRRIDGSMRQPICAQATAKKIRKLYDNGTLGPYVIYLDGGPFVAISDGKESQPQSKTAVVKPNLDAGDLSQWRRDHWGEIVRAVEAFCSKRARDIKFASAPLGPFMIPEVPYRYYEKAIIEIIRHHDPVFCDLDMRMADRLEVGEYEQALELLQSIRCALDHWKLLK